MKPSRQLTTFAFVSQSIYGTNDLLSGLMPFFEPIINELKGEIFDPNRFAECVRTTYGWPVNTDVVSELIPRLEGIGWLKELRKEGGSAVYTITGSDISILPDKDIEKLENSLSRIAYLFKEFATNLSPLITFDHTIEDYQEFLLNWLVESEEIDARGIVAAAATAGIVPSSQAASVKYSDEQLSRKNKNETSYLCARFVMHLEKAEPELFERIVDICAVAILTEVVLDFHNPPQAGRKEPDQTVVVDAPFLMDALQLTGTHLHNNATSLLDQLREMQCRLTVFPHICDEVRDNLKAVFQ